jgi:hypothetical protein
MASPRVAVVYFSLPARLQPLAWLAVVYATMSLLSFSSARAQGLSLDTQQGQVGETIRITVQIDSAPTSIQAFGFDVTYDPQVLQYTGTHSAGGMSSGFDFFQASAPSPGLIRIAGFTTKHQVEAGSSGDFATLEFRVLRPGNATLSLVHPVDDVAAWPMQAGLFEGTTPPAPSQTANTTSPSLNTRAEPSAPSPANLPTIRQTAPQAQRPAEQPAAPQQRSTSSPSIIVQSLPEAATKSLAPTTVMRSTPEGAATSAAAPAQEQGATQRLPAPAPAQQQAPGAESPTAKPTPPPVRSAETRSVQHMPQGESATTRDKPQQLAQEGTTVSRSPGGGAAPVPGKGQNTPQTQPGSAAAPPSDLFFQNFRVIVPVVAIVILGVVVIALVSLKRPE